MSAAHPKQPPHEKIPEILVYKHGFPRNLVPHMPMPTPPPAPAPDPENSPKPTFDPDSFNPEALDPSLGAETGSNPQTPAFSFGAKLFGLILFGILFVIGEKLHHDPGPPGAGGPFDTQLIVLYVIALVVILWADGVFDRTPRS